MAGDVLVKAVVWLTPLASLDLKGRKETRGSCDR